MESLVAVTAVIFMLLVVVEIFYAAYSLPLFKDVYPEEFKACGSPSMIFIGNGVFLSYLIRNQHRRLDDLFVVRLLDRHKWILIFEGASLAMFALALATSIAA